MISIDPIHYYPASAIQLRNEAVTPSRVSTDITVSRAPETSAEQATGIPFDQLPSTPTHDISRIIRRIDANLHQAAESGQTLENRELLQRRIRDEVPELEAIFRTLSRDELELFAAFFKNLPISIEPGRIYSNGYQDSYSDPIAQNRFPENFLESFNEIDAITLPGLLSALDLTGTISSLLSNGNTGTGVLEFLLEELSVSTVSSLNIQSSGPDQEEAPTAEERDIERFPARDRYGIPIFSDPDQQSITDLIG